MQKSYDLYGVGRSQMAVYAPYPFGGNRDNTEERYTVLSEQLDCHVIAEHAPATGQIRPNQYDRRAVREKHTLVNIAERYALALGNLTSRYSTVVALGDSGRAVWVAAMQTSGAKPFTHVVTRDGANLEAPEPIVRGAMRTLLRGGDRGDTGSPEITGSRLPIAAQLRTAVCGLAEMQAYGHLMCRTTASVSLLADVACQPELPFCNVMVGSGVSGSAAAAQAFNQRLATIRAEVRGGEARNFMPIYEPDWGHNNLLDPTPAANHIQAVLGQ